MSEDVEKAPLLYGGGSTNSSDTPFAKAGCSRKGAGAGAALSERDALHTSLKSLIGSGLLAMPIVFRISGVLGGAIICLSSVLLCYYGGVLLVRSKMLLLERHPDMSEDSLGRALTYGDIAEGVLGSKARVAVDGGIVVLQIGTIVAYEIFVSENMRSLAPTFSSSVIVWCCALLLVPLFLVDKVAHLAKMALLADLLIFSGIVLCIGMIGTEGNFARPHMFGDASSFLSLGIAIFAIEGICLILPVQSSMLDESKYIKCVWKPSMLFAATLYSLFGTLGYSAFGDRTHDIILLNLPSSPLKTLLLIFYSSALLLSAPLQAFPVFELIENDYLQRLDKTTRKQAVFMLRVLTVICTTAIASAVPHFAVVGGVLGTISGASLGFGVPALFYLRLQRDNLSCCETVPLYGIIIASFVIAVSGVMSVVSLD